MKTPMFLSPVRYLRRYPRHFRNLLVHSTPRRVFNLLEVELEFRLGRTKLRGKPYIVFIDPVNVCNLRCPLCPTGTGELARRRGSMTLDQCRKAIDEVAPWAYEVVFYNWGEPLLNRHIFEMVKYARSKNLGTSMSSNLALVRPEMFDEIILSGLENISISIDGASPETYEKYRVGGDFDTVVGNLRTLVERRRALGSHTPTIEWQFIVMRHNEHEIERARAMAKEVGADVVSFIPVALPFDAKEKETLAAEWFSSIPEYRYSDTAMGWTVTKGPWRRWFSWVSRYRNLSRDQTNGDRAALAPSTRCFYLYRSLTVNPGGGIAPCCVIYDELQDSGNIASGLKDVWNNDVYRSMRSEFHPREEPRYETVCSNCHIFNRQPKQTMGGVRIPLHLRIGKHPEQVTGEVMFPLSPTEKRNGHSNGHGPGAEELVEELQEVGGRSNDV